ncbi:hypothetical protein [Frigoribacterium sp. MCBA15_019]|uniref:hypothetical protein n=1 Tax=Frigoribacterium sp. MCBA15_019 TaxID=1898745 RepID=UPI0008DE28B1|nr:hypothetical protein [Frigoribacterium sp. MCBA15_019]OII27563.1 hypothetical protein BIV04_03235 [Frigoribacterium sp. MCBA15_019]
MIRPYRRVRERLGRRGLALVVFSLVFALTGLRAILAPTEDDGRFILYTFLPVPMRVILWFVPAALGLWAAFRGTGRDAIGFSALVIPATAIAFSYVWSWVGYFAGLTDWSLGWTGAARWLLVLALVLIVSGWKEADEPPPSTISTHEGGPRA